MADSSIAGQESDCNAGRYKSASDKIFSPLTSSILPDPLSESNLELMQRVFNAGHTVPMEVRIDTSGERIAQRDSVRVTREGVSSKRRSDA